MNKQKMNQIIHNTIYTNVAYPHVGNNNILASNLILFKCGITDIDTIASFAKIIEKNLTYDHEISADDSEKILTQLSIIIKKKFF